jgi:hypothetical protein
MIGDVICANEKIYIVEEIRNAGAYEFFILSAQSKNWVLMKPCSQIVILVRIK